MADNNNPIYYSDLVKPDNAIEKLIAQLEALMTKYEETRKTIKDEAIQITASLEMVSGATEQGRQTTKKAASDADRLAKAQEQLRFAESESAKKLAELNEAKREQNQINKLVTKLNNSAEGSYNRLSAQYSLNKIYLNNMTKAERESTEAGRKLVKQTREIYDQMKNLQEATGKHQLNVGNYTEVSDALISYSDRMKDALHLNGAFAQSIIAIGKGGKESKNALKAISDGVKAVGKSITSLLKNPAVLAVGGIAAGGLGVKWWFDYNAGLVEATRLTKQFTNKSGQDLQYFRNEIISISETFNVDFNETMMAVNAMAKQFDITFNEALKNVKNGFIAGGNANGEFLDTLKEYPAYFKEAGISADEFTAIVVQAGKSGIFSDKAIDAIKEANLRIREMTKATHDALKGIGLDADELQKQMRAGALSTFDVMKMVSEKLNEFPATSKEVGTAIADIFGGPGEDAGLQYLQTLKDIKTNMYDVIDTADEMSKLQAEVLQSQIELQNALSDTFDMTGGIYETLTSKVKVFINESIAGLVKMSGFIWDVSTKDFPTAIKNLYEGNTRREKEMMESHEKTLTSYFGKSNEAYLKQSAAALGVSYGEKQEPAAEKKHEGKGRLSSPGTRNAKKEMTPEDRAEIERQNQLKELEIIRKGIELRLSAVREGSEEELRLKIELLRNNEAREQIMNHEGNARQIAENSQNIKIKYNIMEANIRDSYNELQLAEFDAQQKLAKSEFDLLETTEAEKTRFRLEAEKERWLKILKINETANQKMSETEIKTIENTIAKLNSEIQQTYEDKKDGKQKDFYDFVGLDLSEEKKEAINTSLEYAKNAINDYMAAEVAAADAAVNNADKQVESAERALDAERMARANGYAANVEMAQKELNQAKKNQKDALKEQERAKKQQLAIQSIEQVGNLVTASSLIWSQLGFPGAIPALAVMWASFAASKIKAAQAISAGSERYADGTVELLAGGSHASGHDIDMGRTPDGRHRRAEGGEFFAVINKRNSRRYRHVIPDVIHSFNDGTFGQKYTNTIDNGLSLNMVGGGPDITDLSNDVRAIKEQNERRTYVDASGRTVTVYKNLTRKIN